MLKKVIEKSKAWEQNWCSYNYIQNPNAKLLIEITILGQQLKLKEESFSLFLGHFFDCNKSHSLSRMYRWLRRALTLRCSGLIRSIAACSLQDAGWNSNVGGVLRIPYGSLIEFQTPMWDSRYLVVQWKFRNKAKWFLQETSSIPSTNQKRSVRFLCRRKNMHIFEK